MIENPQKKNLQTKLVLKCTILMVFNLRVQSEIQVSPIFIKVCTRIFVLEYRVYSELNHELLFQQTADRYGA